MIKPHLLLPLVVAMTCLTSRLSGQTPMLVPERGGIDLRPDRLPNVQLPSDVASQDQQFDGDQVPNEVEFLPPPSSEFPTVDLDVLADGMLEPSVLEPLAPMDEVIFPVPPEAPIVAKLGNAIQMLPDSGFLGDTTVTEEQPIGCDACGELAATCENGSCGCNPSSIADDWTPWQSLHASRPRLDLSFLDVGKSFRQSRTRDRGIGYERVMYAPLVLDPAIGTPHFGIRYQLDSGLRTPDRAEYYWSTDPVGPGGDFRVDAQDLSFRLAIGNEKAMAFTQYTLRSLDPTNSGNTTGMGDMIIGAQALMVDGKRTKVSSIFRTYLATGPAQRGLGTGHTSLEPGVLLRHCTSPETYWFGELKYWVPLGASPNDAGDVLSTGIGVSSIAAESDVYAFMPTLEMRTLSFLFGSESTGTGSRRIDGNTAVEFYPGARFVLGPRRDTGLLEFGFSPGITIADSDWFDTRIVFDIRLIR